MPTVHSLLRPRFIFCLVLRLRKTKTFWHWVLHRTSFACVVRTPGDKPIRFRFVLKFIFFLTNGGHFSSALISSSQYTNNVLFHCFLTRGRTPWLPSLRASDRALSMESMRCYSCTCCTNRSPTITWALLVRTICVSFWRCVFNHALRA